MSYPWQGAEATSDLAVVHLEEYNTAFVARLIALTVEVGLPQTNHRHATTW